MLNGIALFPLVTANIQIYSNPHRKWFFPSFLFVYEYFFVLLRPETKDKEIMTALELNAEMLRSMSLIAEDENLLKRAVKYLRKLVAEKEDPTLFTKEEFFHRVDEAKKGPSYRLEEGETIEDLIARVG